MVGVTQHTQALCANAAGLDDPQPGDSIEDPDIELAYARDLRRRQVEILAFAEPPVSAEEMAAERRARIVEVLRFGCSA